MWFRARTAASLALLLSLGCGRLGFEPLSSEPIGAVDAGDCDAPGMLVCATFDDDALPAGATIETEGDGEVTIAEGMAIAVSREPEARAVVRLPLGDAFTSGTLYVQLHIFVPGDFAIDQLNFATLSSGFGSREDVDFNLLDENRFEVYLAPEDSSVEAPFREPRDRFFCASFAVTLDDRFGSVRVEVDGDEVLSARRRDTVPRGGVREVRVGLDYTSRRQDEAEVRIDDLVVSTEPLSGC